MLALLLLQILLGAPAQAGFAAFGDVNQNQPPGLIWEAQAATESVAWSGSAIHGDGNVHITATDGDLKVRGSTIEAGQDVALAAQKGNVLLQAAENRFAEQNSNSSSSASLGVGFNVGAGSA